MLEKLIEHIKKFLPIAEEDVPVVLSFFQEATVKKKENVQEADKVCKQHYFVTKGCLRMFFVNEKGIEQTTYFALENWWITDYLSFQTGQPAEYTIQAIEPSEVISISAEKQEALLQQFPQMERYFRIIFQRSTAAAQRRLKLLYQLTREELYLAFSKQYPEFVQRIPQYLLASFLGFTPEYLSELRKKMVLKQV